MSRRAVWALAAVVAVICVTFFALHFSNGNGGGSHDGGGGSSSDPVMEYDPEEIPDFVTADPDRAVLRTDAQRVWNVRSMFHTHYAMSGGSFTTVYEGEETCGDSVSLDPGWYRITVGGETFDVLVNGPMRCGLSWTYDLDGSKVDASVSFDIDAKELFDEYRIADGMNSCSGDRDRYSGYVSDHRFSDLTKFARTCPAVSDVQSQLRSEFLRLGGDQSDRQSYADFIAGFVQLAIVYPPSVPDHSGEFDLGQYGWAEYWATPLQTLYHGMGDCEDVSALFCVLAADAGFDVAMAGKAGHVFAGIVLDDFEEVSEDRLKAISTTAGYFGHVSHVAIGAADDSPVYHAVELIKGQAPVGYAPAVDFGSNTLWGVTGFYPLASG